MDVYNNDIMLLWSAPHNGKIYVPVFSDVINLFV